MLMQKVAKIVTGNPKKIVAVVLVITLLMGSVIYIKGINFKTDEKTYLPDTEITRASFEITENYTAVDRITILVKNGDVLTNSSLIEMLEIEKKILENKEVQKILDNPDFLESNVNSIADMITQNLFVMELQEEIMKLVYLGQLNLTQMNITEEQLEMIFYKLPSYLTIEAKIKVLKGGTLTINDLNLQEINKTELKDFILPMSYLNLTLTFNEVNNTKVKDTTKLVARNGFAKSLLTKDFNLTNNLKAKGTLIMISANATLEDKIDKFLIAEKEMDKIAKTSKVNKVSVIGNEVIWNEIDKSVNDSMRYLMPIAFVLVIVILLFIYRSVRDMLFSLLALMFAIIWVYGFGVIFNFTFNPMTTAVPILIIGVGIDYGIYITMRYREEMRKGQDVKKSVFMTIAFLGSSLFLIMLTSVSSFLSNITSPITILKEFGILCAVGVLSSFLIMNTFVPALKQLKDSRREKKGLPIIKENKNGKKTKSVGVETLDKFLSKSAVASEHHPYIVIGVVLILTAGSFYGVVNVRTEFNFKDFLPKNLDLTQDIIFVMDEFDYGRRESADILIKGDISNPALLKAIDETTKNINNDKYVVKYNNSAEVSSILMFMYDYATITENDYRFNATFSLKYNQYFENKVPRANTTREKIIELYDWLYENANKDVRTVLHKDRASYDGTIIKISVDTDNGNREKSAMLYDELNEDITPLKKYAKATVTSGPVLTYVILNAINESQIRSIIITIISCVIILSIIFYYLKKSFVLGFVASIPVMLCAVWNIASMYFLGIPLNVITLTIASLTIGLGIEYGIQITYRFLEDLENNEIDDACRLTVKEMGSSLVGCVGTTVAAFGLLIFSIMPPLQQFGGMMALTIVYAFLSSVFVLPTILVLWAKYRKKNGSLEMKKKDEDKEKEEEIKSI